MKINVCMGTNCMMNGAMQLFDQLNSLNDLIRENPEYYSVDSLNVEPVKCQKICKQQADYANCVVIVDGNRIEDMKGSAMLEYVMSLIKK